MGEHEWSKGTCFIINATVTNYIGKILTHLIRTDSWKILIANIFICSVEVCDSVSIFFLTIERCEHDKKKKKKRSNLCLSAGPGKNLAMIELKATLVMLCRKYDIELMGPLKERIVAGRRCDELKIRLRKKVNLAL